MLIISDVLFVLLIFSTLVLIIVILPYILGRFKSRRIFQNVVDARAVLQNAQEGDVLAISKKLESHYIFMTAFTQSIWGHAAVVFIDEGVKYVVEITNNGFKQSRMEKWLDAQNKRGNNIAWTTSTTRLRTNNSIVLHRYLNSLVENNVQLNTNYLQWLAEKITSRKINSGTKYYCSEFVATFLQKIGILDNSICTCSFTPGDLVMGNYNQYLKHHFDPPALVRLPGVTVFATAAGVAATAI